MKKNQQQPQPQCISTRSLYWLRNDVRVHDNKTLSRCCSVSESILFVCAETPSTKRASIFRKQFISESFADFNQTLIARAQKLIRTSLSFSEFLDYFLKQNSIETLFYTREHAVEEKLEEQKVLEICKRHRVNVESFFQTTLIALEDLSFSLADMPFSFTEFRKSVESRLNIRPSLEVPNVWPTAQFKITGEQELKLIPIDNVRFSTNHFCGGETAGLVRIQDYIWNKRAIQNYKLTRNGMLNFDHSTKFSPWLNIGCISPRKVMDEVKKFESEVIQNESTYWIFFELLWRDYFKFFSMGHGKNIFQLKGVTQNRKYEYIQDRNLFENWCQAKTGVDFIDANMIELNQTGWMSNRGATKCCKFSNPSVESALDLGCFIF